MIFMLGFLGINAESCFYPLPSLENSVMKLHDLAFVKNLFMVWEYSTWIHCYEFKFLSDVESLKCEDIDFGIDFIIYISRIYGWD